eukprot:TRINITY_DN100716_c0_g1_i1.p1 TRINITY_DN100716_c0_g1~~TRINITY_DN100716_c0_g1_i1.p1  ORF type:complete len:319 (-),score=39.93 TRINITY_DN100716_c0_g1_i1:667-1623(-)
MHGSTLNRLQRMIAATRLDESPITISADTDMDTEVPTETESEKGSEESDRSHSFGIGLPRLLGAVPRPPRKMMEVDMRRGVAPGVWGPCWLALETGRMQTVHQGEHAGILRTPHSASGGIATATQCTGILRKPHSASGGVATATSVAARGHFGSVDHVNKESKMGVPAMVASEQAEHILGMRDGSDSPIIPEVVGGTWSIDARKLKSLAKVIVSQHFEPSALCPAPIRMLVCAEEAHDGSRSNFKKSKGCGRIFVKSEVPMQARMVIQVCVEGQRICKPVTHDFSENVTCCLPGPCMLADLVTGGKKSLEVRLTMTKA